VSSAEELSVIVDAEAEKRDEASRKKDDEKKAGLTRRDPRFVPKNKAFYMHDTSRSSTKKQRIPFEKDDEDSEVISTLKDSFKPTKHGKWKHDMHDKICDNTKEHSRGDH